MTRLTKERAALEELVVLYGRYKVFKQELEDAKAMVAAERDPEMLGMAKDEVERLEAALAASERRLIILSL
ncbi:PCRF domain-containing protein, partial [Enterococcus faecium]